MASVDEALGAPTALASDLRAGVEQLSLNQEITFTKYVKVILPLDGFVFWVRADLLGPQALYNAWVYNQVVFAEAPVVTAAPTTTVRGSLHYATNQVQDEDATYGKNSLIFTSEAEVQEFNQVGPMTVLIGTFDGMRFAFSQRRSFYTQAGLHHYVGDALYSTMETQVVDRLDDLATQVPVVSNSLPAWLALNSYAPKYPTPTRPAVPLYPSYAVPDNLPPPYGVVHILPDSTVALQSAPLLGSSFSHSQLTTERVRLTLYGLRNDQALDFLDCVNQYTLDTDLFGLMNSPVPRDEKKVQSELSILAMKKVLDFEINYYQSTMRNLGRQLILEALPTFTIQD